MPARVQPGIVKRALLDQVAAECGDEVWALCRDAEANVHECATGRCDPTLSQRQFASRLMDALDAHADLDGTWAVAWCDPALSQVMRGLWLRVPTRLVWMHLDQDGDVNFLVDNECGIDRLVEDGVEPRVADAVEAHKQYRSMMADIDVRPDQTRKAALGQASKDPRIKIVPFV